MVDPIATPFGPLEPGEYEIAGMNVFVTEIGCNASPIVPDDQTVWPYEFQALLTDDQLVAIQLSVLPLLIRMRTKVQTLLSVMPFGPTSELYQGVQLLGKVMPDVFPADEVSRILSGNPPA